MNECRELTYTLEIVKESLYGWYFETKRIYKHGRYWHFQDSFTGETSDQYKRFEDLIKSLLLYQLSIGGIDVSKLQYKGFKIIKGDTNKRQYELRFQE